MKFKSIIVAASLAFLSVASTATAQDAKQGGAIPVPAVDANSYDPQLTAKEAALTNWALAVAGIRAGKVVSDGVLASAKNDAPFDTLTKQAKFAIKTLVTRYSAANWIFTSQSDLTPIDGRILLDTVKASEITCDAAPCSKERALVLTAFANASDAFGTLGKLADKAAKAQESKSEHVLMAESLTAMADYLDSSAWYSQLALTEARRDGEEVSARIVGMLAIWNNIEAYVGLTNAEIDNAINERIQSLLMDLRRNTRRKPVLPADSPDIAKVKASATALATELRRAAQLFKD